MIIKAQKLNLFVSHISWHMTCLKGKQIWLKPSAQKPFAPVQTRVVLDNHVQWVCKETKSLGFTWQSCRLTVPPKAFSAVLSLLLASPDALIGNSSTLFTFLFSPTSGVGWELLFPFHTLYEGLSESDALTALSLFLGQNVTLARICRTWRESILVRFGQGTVQCHLAQLLFGLHICKVKDTLS